VLTDYERIPEFVPNIVTSTRLETPEGAPERLVRLRQVPLPPLPPRETHTLFHITFHIGALGAILGSIRWHDLASIAFFVASPTYQRAVGQSWKEEWEMLLINLNPPRIFIPCNQGCLSSHTCMCTLLHYPSPRW